MEAFLQILCEDTDIAELELQMGSFQLKVKPQHDFFLLVQEGLHNVRFVDTTGGVSKVSQLVAQFWVSERVNDGLYQILYQLKSHDSWGAECKPPRAVHQHILRAAAAGPPCWDDAVPPSWLRSTVFNFWQ